MTGTVLALSVHLYPDTRGQVQLSAHFPGWETDAQRGEKHITVGHAAGEQESWDVSMGTAVPSLLLSALPAEWGGWEPWNEEMHGWAECLLAAP